jgi:hypothetical protein
VLYEDGVSRESYVLLPSATSEVEEILGAGLRLVEMTPRRPEAVAGLSLTATGLTAEAENGRLHQLALFTLGQPGEVRVSLGRWLESRREARSHAAG